MPPMNLLARWGLNALALYLTSLLNVGLSFSNTGLVPVLFAALILGLVNAIVRPIMVILTFPFTLITFGLFLLVVNGLALSIVAVLTPLELSGFGGAVLSALVLSVISFLLSRLFWSKKED